MPLTPLHAVDDDPAEHCPSCFYFDHGRCRLNPPHPTLGNPAVGSTDWCSGHATLDGNTDIVKATFR